MKLFESLFRIFNDYKLFIFVIIYFELYYYLSGFKGFKINFSKNKLMADNIPCPYFFLYKIKKTLNNIRFKSVIDLGCGSGRILDFINKNFYKKKISGIEFFDAQYKYCKNIFENNTNIIIKKKDFTKINFKKEHFDVLFLSAPFNKKRDFLNFMKKLSKVKKLKKTIAVIINYEKDLIQNVKNIRFIDSFYLSKEKGYSICII
tara:strand:- start:2961 stop:3572 length:612 start_codon:yes stop_codon:yes gene_type:complete